MKLNREVFKSKEEIIKSIEHYTKSIEDDNKNKRNYLKRCFLNYVICNYDKALEDMKHLKESGNQSPAFLCLSSLILGKLGNTNESFDDIEKSKKINPSFLYNNLAKFVLTHIIKDDNDAFAEINKAIDKKPEDARSILYRGIINIDNDNFDYAIEDFKKAQKFQPLWKKFTDNLIGDAYLKNGIFKTDKEKYYLAIENFNEFIKYNPNNPNGYFYLGEALMNVEDWEGAKDNFKKSSMLGQGNSVSQDADEMISIIDEIIN